MSAKGDGGDFDGTLGHPQMRLDFQAAARETGEVRPAAVYEPSPKHAPGHEWDGASTNPIRSMEEGQRLLETGFRDGKQVYNVTDRGEIVKFQPDNGPTRAYHSYGTVLKRDLPTGVLRWMLKKRPYHPARIQ